MHCIKMDKEFDMLINRTEKKIVDIVYTVDLVASQCLRTTAQCNNFRLLAIGRHITT